MVVLVLGRSFNDMLKLLKISFVKSSFFCGKYSSIFSLKLLSNNSDRTFFATLLRRALIQQSVGFGITNISFFISDSTSKVHCYHMVNEFRDLEEVLPSMDKVLLNIRRVNLKVKNKVIKKENIFARLMVSKSGVYKASDINFPPDFKVIQSSDFLFDVISNSVIINVIMELEV